MNSQTQTENRYVSKRRLWAAVACLIFSLGLTGCKMPSASYDDSTLASTDPSSALVRQLHTRENLGSLAEDEAHVTEAYGRILQRRGVDGADKLIRSEIAKALPRYQTEWDANLASIYSRHFSREELRSLVEEGRQSPYAGKLLTVHTQIAREMRDKSSPLLRQLVTEALTAAEKATEEGS